MFAKSRTQRASQTVVNKQIAIRAGGSRICLTWARRSRRGHPQIAAFWADPVQSLFEPVHPILTERG